MTTLASLVFASSAATHAGEMTGVLFFIAILLAGVIKCASIARRPTTSATCTYGLMAVLIAWLTLRIPTVLRIFGLESLPVTILAVLIGLLCLCAGAVLSIIGLVDYRRHSEYVQGRKQAVWALVLGTILIISTAVIGCASLIKTVRDRYHDSQVTSQGSALGKPIVFENLNLRFQIPPRPYVQWEAAKVNPAATFGFLRTAPQIHFMMVAESGDPDDGLDVEGLTSISKAHFLSKRGTSILGEAPHLVGDLRGIRFFGDLNKGRLDLTYAFWIYARNGFYYQLIAWGHKNDRERVRKDAEMLFSRFEQLDPDRRTRDSGSELFGRYQSSTFGFIVDLRGTRWRKWAEASQDNPEAEVGGLYGKNAGFLVTPFVFDGKAPRLDALTQAALKVWDIEFPSQSITHLTRVREGDMDGYTFHHRRSVSDTPYDYRMKILRGAGSGVMVGVWQVEGMSGLDARAAEVSHGWRHARPRRVLTIARLPERLRLAHGVLYNRIGLFHFAARDYAASLRAFKVAVRVQSSEQSYLLNALRAYGELERWKDGLEYLRSLEHPSRNDDEIRSWEAWFCKQDGQQQAALDIYRELFAGSFRGDDDFKAYTALLAESGRWKELNRSFDRYLARHARLDLRLEQARLLGDGERHQDAVDVLEREQRGIPFSADIAWALIEHFDAMDQQQRRLALCEALAQNGFASFDVYYVKGDAEARLKRPQQAKSAFEQALKYKPDDPETRKYLRIVSAQLGEGNNTDVKTDIPDIPLPQTIAQRISTLSTSDVAGFGAHYVYWIEGFSFSKGERESSTTRQRIKISDKSGVERFSTIQLDFDPLLEQIFVNDLVVTDAGGAVVSRGQSSDYYVLDKQRGQMATHDRTLYVPVPSLASGRLIDLTVTRRNLGPSDELTFRAIPLSGDRPIRYKVAYFLGDTTALRFRCDNGVEAVPIPGGLVWSVERPMLYPWEPLRVAPEKIIPHVWIGDAHATWTDLIAKYMESIRDKLVSSAVVDSRARRLTHGLSDRQRRIDALARHVQTSYVYKPLEFGRRARVPNTAEETIQRRYGDCKDHAVLLRQLLLASSIPAELALVNTDAELQRDIPSLDQFNHVVVYIPPDDGTSGRFYDTTDKGLSMSVSPPLALGGREALIINRDAPRFETLPLYGDNSSVLRVKRDVRIASDGTLHVDESLLLTGYYAATLRDFLSSLDADDHKLWGQRAIAEYERNAALVSLTTHNVRDPDKALEIDVTYDLVAHCRGKGAALRCALPNAWEARYLEVSQVPQRRTPFALKYPLRFFATTTARPLDAGGRIEPGPESLQGRSDFIDWSAQTTTMGAGVTVRLEGMLKVGEFPASRYSEYGRVASEALRSAGREIVWRR
jgi:tetratricopeptide (TPR) repeat protein